MRGLRGKKEVCGMHVFFAFNPATPSVPHKSSCISVCSHHETFVSFSPYISKRKLYTVGKILQYQLVFYSKHYVHEASKEIIGGVYNKVFSIWLII